MLKKMISGLAIIGLAFAVTTGSAWAAKNVPSAPIGEVEALAKGVPDISATSFLLVDFESGTELASYHAGERIEPASITKLMTAYIIYRELARGSITMEDKVLISQKARGMKGSRMFVEAGKRVTLEQLLRGLIIQSGNDAAVALAEHIAGSEGSFVERMNKTALELGMNDTHYRNVTGWPDKEHYTSARDIVKLARALVSEFPDRYKLYSEKSFIYNKIKQHNRNKLLWRDDSVDGMKTGYTESAGYCLVASAKRENTRLISVVLGTASENSRAENAQKLLEYGFRAFETHKIYDANSVLHEARIWKGETETVPAGVQEDVYVSMPKGRYGQLKGSIQLDKSIDAPISRGDVLGKIIFADEGKIIKEMPLVALEEVAEGGLWRKMSDSVQKLFAD